LQPCFCQLTKLISPSYRGQRLTGGAKPPVLLSSASLAPICCFVRRYLATFQRIRSYRGRARPNMEEKLANLSSIRSTILYVNTPNILAGCMVFICLDRPCYDGHTHPQNVSNKSSEASNGPLLTHKGPYFLCITPIYTSNPTVLTMCPHLSPVWYSSE